ncbi:MAG: TraB/GumN family protein [Rhizomicrobium sp.]
MAGAFAAALLALGAAPAAQAPVQDWSNVEVVVVTPDHPGPALWHIVKGASEVWILPTVSPVPEDMIWDSHQVAAVLKGANALLLPPRASMGVFEGLWFWMTGMDVLEQPDASSSKPRCRRRCAPASSRPARASAGTPTAMANSSAGSRRCGWKAITGSSPRLTPNGPQKTVESLASRAGISAKATANYPAMDVIRDVPNMTAAAHLTCLTLALDDIDTQSAHAVAAAQAWAKGDVAGIKAHYSETRLDDCLNQNAAYRVLRETANRDMTNAILAALNKPGTTVAVMPMGFFLRKGGVLERLEASGLTVTGPG